MSQNSSLKEDESRLYNFTDQAADGTQIQTSEEAEPMAVHFADNSKLQPFSKSHEYQQNIRHWLRTWGRGQNWRKNSEEKCWYFRVSAYLLD